ncbi:MAG: hypothetical protein ABIP31_02920, partial [Chitinophagaceae bacterium]
MPKAENLSFRVTAAIYSTYIFKNRNIYVRSKAFIKAVDFFVKTYSSSPVFVILANTKNAPFVT